MTHLYRHFDKSGLDLNGIVEIILAEFSYWKEADVDQSPGGMGAASNILAAIKGHRAPWHPKLPNAALSGWPGKNETETEK